MLKRVWILLPVILLCLLVGAKEAPREDVSQTPGRPNILLVLTDDQDAGSISEMPNVQSQLVDRGTTYDRAFVTTPLCCPSRTSILRGQYAHNHGLWDNKPPKGGFQGFQELGLERSTVATWLDDAGYHTGFMGKYLNEYGDYDDPTTHVPPGWDRWIGYQDGPQEQSIRGAFKVNDQGKVVRIDATEEHDTDYFTRKAEIYIRNRQASRPWFLMVATNAPHVPAKASARNENAYAGRTLPKTPSFNEADISDKASLWRDNALLPEECPTGARKDPDENLQCVPEADEAWRNRMESLRDVDDMIARLLAALHEKGFTRETYVILTSDNGFALYQNRIFSKGAPYEPAQRVPFIVRGPGVSKDRVDHHLVANIDLAPTFAQWAKTKAPDFVDGRNLVPILHNRNATTWRTRLLFEHHLGDKDFEAIRTVANQVYIKYPSTDETEYYDLDSEPYQLHGQAERPPPQLAEQLKELMRCAGASCRVADGSP